jgi:hypothetical protein
MEAGHISRPARHKNVEKHNQYTDKPEDKYFIIISA